ncbi:DUF1015 domain-containing protein [Anaeromyxobacter paludicola]|uniref:DUF1015 domain-containing protein n=1 Tax=Anaeromyxobacter paludicola TaxID=2918171 RepID=A0ABM7X5V4_9BACT|nr:DUF1015 domain-containing protein [Anaeromyxobacter paludicola]BDG07194.1 hypothetical protein AMPC_03070 [Anaeromyxobacter paludicola]
MAAIAPFRGIRFATARAGRLGELISPPYDCISPGQQEQLLGRSPYNVTHLILGKEKAGDGPGENKYTRAAHTFQDWLAEGILRVDPRPAIYPSEQSFTAPDGRRLTRRGVIVACRLTDYREGLVIPHEKTLSAPKVDRLELIRNVKANLSPVFGFYQDDLHEVTGAVAPSALETIAEAISDDGVHHRLWRVDDPAVIATVREILAPKRVFIADGHTRYETALTYRDELDRARPGLPEDGGHRYVLMYLCATSDPGVVIYPTHRVVFGLPDLELSTLLPRLERWFRVETLEEDVRRTAGRAWAVSKLAEHGGKSTAFLMVSAADQKARVLTLRDDADLGIPELPRNDTLRALDVEILHGLIFEHVLGLSLDAQEHERSLGFVRDTGEAIHGALAGRYQLAFVVNPTPMWQVQAVADASETMPQKSTFFYPKLATGMVMRAVDPAERP